MATVKIYSNDEVLDWSASGVDRIIQNARNILRTRKFEVPFMRLMGISSDFIDTSHKKLTSEIRNEIENVLEAYEDRVTVVDVWLESVDGNGNYVIGVELEV